MDNIITLPKNAQTIYEALNEGKKRGLMQLYTQDSNYNGAHVNVNGKRLKNFFSCSYLGLELDDSLAEGSIEATRKFGTQFSASRGYISCGLYEELETLFSQIFDGYPVVSASTTLGHMNNVPLLVGDKDCVLFDWQVHNSVKSALNHVKVRGVETKPIKHNDMNKLEENLIELSAQFDKIWYFCDGIYSMFGDATPVAELDRLMEKYDNFHLYVDDAHGMSIKGENGRGYYLSETKQHKKAVVVTSLAKAFGVTGGVTIVQDKELQGVLKTCGQSLIFSGPLTPPVLGACVASAKLHLCKTINEKQSELTRLINFTNYLMKHYDLPVFFETNTPICFVGVGDKNVGYNLMRRLFADNYLVNIAIFPAVSLKNTGIRFTVNLHQNEDDILCLIRSIAHNLEIAMVEEGYTREQLLKDFKLQKKEFKELQAI